MTDQLEAVAQNVVKQGGQYGCLIIIAGPQGTKTIPYVDGKQDPTVTAQQLLAAHYDHIVRSADRLGMDLDVREVAEETAESYMDATEAPAERE